ncbi:MAG: hypothetical protein VYD19_03835 [Myxococcota bacterium]|nr:hypothetical protein [Myxococcota bacterium]
METKTVQIQSIPTPTFQSAEAAAPEARLSPPLGGELYTFELPKAGAEGEGLPCELRVDLFPQAAASAILSCGGASALATVSMDQDESPRDFLPLTVEYLEPSSAADRVPGGRSRRDGRPGEEETLTARMIDRGLRAQIDASERRSIFVQVKIIRVGSGEGLDVLAFNAASAALAASPISAQRPVVAAIVKTEDRRKSAKGGRGLDGRLVVTGSAEGVVAFEGISSPISASGLVTRAERAIGALAPLSSLLETIQEKSAAPAWSAPARSEEATAHRAELLAGQRRDGRAPHELRAIELLPDPFPGATGSVMLRRGKTQVYAAVTPCGAREMPEEQAGLSKTARRPLFLHYAFPGAAVGALRYGRSPSRREIGHGRLAERALTPFFIPRRGAEAVRVMTETFSSDGSSSMASVCAGSVALTRAGFPLSDSVVGLSLGLVRGVVDGESCAQLLLDISAAEDANGEMDLKVAGSAEGISAVQLDIKGEQLPWALLRAGLEAGQSAFPAIHNALSAHLKPAEGVPLPESQTLWIYPQQVEKLNAALEEIGTESGAQVEVDERGRVTLRALTQAQVKSAAALIAKISVKLQVGRVYTAEVSAIELDGAGVEVRFGEHQAFLERSSLTEIDGLGSLEVGVSLRVKLTGIDARGVLILAALPPKRGRGQRRSAGDEVSNVDSDAAAKESAGETPAEDIEATPAPLEGQGDTTQSEEEQSATVEP